MSFRKLAAAVCVVGLMGAVAPTAAAYEGKDLDNATIINAKHSFVEGENVHVVAENLRPNTDYLLGQCGWQTHSMYGFADIPACASDGQQKARTDAKGRLDTLFPAVAWSQNAHSRIPGQRPAIDFTYTHAEIVIVEDHGRGFRGSQAADTAETFVVQATK